MAANPGTYLTVNLYAEGQGVLTINMTGDEPVRIPNVTRSYYWEIEVTGNVPVRRVTIATSVDELEQA
jgi:hypothetical protein